jgi:hypothetical protein
VLQVLRKARIVGMTTSGVAIMQKLITALQPKVLVVEEAGELFEANLLACLGPQTEHIILIGELLSCRTRVACDCKVGLACRWCTVSNSGIHGNSAVGERDVWHAMV